MSKLSRRRSAWDLPGWDLCSHLDPTVPNARRLARANARTLDGIDNLVRRDIAHCRAGSQVCVQVEICIGANLAGVYIYRACWVRRGIGDPLGDVVCAAGNVENGAIENRRLANDI